MGSSANGMLVYGYDLGGEDGEWKIREVGEYGALKLSWYEEPEGEDEDSEDDEFTEAAKRRLLVASGFTETYEDGRDGYFARESEAEAALGVEFDSYCSGDYPMWVLAAKVLTAHQGHCDALDLVELSNPETLAGWDAKLTLALGVLGMTPVQEKPSWLLCSYWG